MSEDVQLKILDSFDRMLDLFAEELSYEFEECDEDCEEEDLVIPGMECKVPEVEPEA